VEGHVLEVDDVEGVGEGSGEGFGGEEVEGLVVELVVGEEEGERRVGGGIGVEVDAEGFTVVALSALFGFGFDFAALLRFEDGWVARGLAGAVEDGEPDDSWPNLVGKVEERRAVRHCERLCGVFGR